MQERHFLPVLAVLLVSLSARSEEQVIPFGKRGTGIRILSKTILSTQGSTRATAYSMSNKIVTWKGKILVSWLDRVSDIRAKTYDVANQSWGPTVPIGTGVDNHSGPALTMDGAGHFHIVYGTHHHSFKYRRSANSQDAGTWEQTRFFGKKGTYPSLVCGSDGTLYCAYRSSSTNPWRLLFQQREKDGAWTAPKPIVDAGVKGYSQFGNSLAISAKGAVHLAFHIYDSQSPAAGKAVGYLRSIDRGESWETAGGEQVELPVTRQSRCYIEQGGKLDMRIGDVVLDSEGEPWLAAIHLERPPRSVVLWHYGAQTWQSINLLPHLQRVMPNFEMVDATITFDNEDILYAFCTVEKTLGRNVNWWGHRSQEVVLLTSRDRGRHFEVLPISELDPQRPNWLPSIERPFSGQSINVPSLLFTHGGPGKGGTGGAATEVIFVRLGK